MAKYFYYKSNGEKVGPLPVSAIKLQIQQGNITPETNIEDEQGNRDLVKNIMGLTGSSASSVTNTDDYYQTINSTSDSTDDGSNNAEPLSKGMILGGKYRLESIAGRGGMGVIWKAFDQTGERWVALKFVPREIQRFESEMKQVKDVFKTIHQLNHQYICPVYALEEDPNYGYYQVLKWLDGISLDAYLKSKKGEKITSKNIENILYPLAEGLDYAHRHGVIHRDVKPSNIFITLKDGRIEETYLIDFGLATAIRETLTRVSQMQFNTKEARPYMPPELWRGQKQNARTDQYSLAVIAYELYAGNLPFSGNNTEQLGYAILQKTPERIKGVSDSINDTLQKALSKDQDDRFECCEAFVQALIDCKIQGQQPITPSISKKKKANQDTKKGSISPKSRKIFLRGGILLMILAAFTVGWVTKGNNQKSEEKIELSPIAVEKNVPSTIQEHNPKIGQKAGEKLTITVQGVNYIFSWCPAGSFMMGSPETEEEHNNNEFRHKVTLSRGFWMLETEVTQQMWKSIMGQNLNIFQKTWKNIMGDNPSNFKGENRPVERVSWNDCQKFIEKLNKESAIQGIYNASLPSEAQWEYACRAGTETPYSFGSTLNGDNANCDGFFPYGTDIRGKNIKETTNVKSYSPNAWGLYDMHGNVLEWCSDRYGEDYYTNSPETDPAGPINGPNRVCRGGSWFGLAKYCRSADRTENNPSVRGDFLGFRLILLPIGQ